ncbi:hypothetical protein RFI_07211, partial [Reticulomyxa filosa]
KADSALSLAELEELQELEMLEDYKFDSVRRNLNASGIVSSVPSGRNVDNVNAGVGSEQEGQEQEQEQGQGQDQDFPLIRVLANTLRTGASTGLELPSSLRVNFRRFRSDTDRSSRAHSDTTPCGGRRHANSPLHEEKEEQAARTRSRTQLLRKEAEQQEEEEEEEEEEAEEEEEVEEITERGDIDMKEAENKQQEETEEIENKEFVLMEEKQSNRQLQDLANDPLYLLRQRRMCESARLQCNTTNDKIEYTRPLIELDHFAHQEGDLFHSIYMDPVLMDQASDPHILLKCGHVCAVKAWDDILETKRRQRDTYDFVLFCFFKKILDLFE